MKNQVQAKIMSLEEAIAWRRALERDKQKLVITNGCFDLLHRGHAEYLLDARAKGDALLVALNSDDSVQELKGPSRPITCQDDRAFLIASLAFVDAVVVFDSLRCDKLILGLRPDVYVKGGDYDINTIDKDEKEALQAVRCAIRFVPFIKGYSSTVIIQKASEQDMESLTDPDNIGNIE